MSEKPSYEYLLLHYGELEREIIGLSRLIEEMKCERRTKDMIINTQKIQIKEKGLS